jgi:hypothetical protein
MIVEMLSDSKSPITAAPETQNGANKASAFYGVKTDAK